jgi:hypothetical protein
MLSAYLIFLGLYNSATSVANGVILRRYIKKSTLAATKLLDDIGTAQVNKDKSDPILLFNGAFFTMPPFRHFL